MDLPQTRQSLILRLQAKSEDAWFELISIYEKSVFDFARSKGLQEADAFDVTQEVFAALDAKVLRWKTGADRGRFRAWLFTVARNLAINRIAERARRPRTGNVLSDRADSREDVSQDSAEFLAGYRKRLLHWAMDRIRPTISEKSWQAFWMAAMMDEDATEVGNLLQMSRGAVYSSKFRVAAKIRKLVERYDYHEDTDPPWRETEVGELDAES